MDTSVETDKAIGKARGRKDADKQEQVIKTKFVVDRIADLCDLYSKAQATNDKLNDAIKAVAEQSGLLAATVRKFVVARAGENFEEAERKVVQLALIFDEIGPVKGSRNGTM